MDQHPSQVLRASHGSAVALSFGLFKPSDNSLAVLPNYYYYYSSKCSIPYLAPGREEVNSVSHKAVAESIVSSKPSNWPCPIIYNICSYRRDACLDYKNTECFSHSSSVAAQVEESSTWGLHSNPLPNTRGIIGSSAIRMVLKPWIFYLVHHQRS